MDKETVREQLRDYAEMTERAIDSYLPETECLQKNVILAARHSLTAGGKRLRPALVMEFCRVSGGEAASALPVACAIEMMHTTTCAAAGRAVTRLSGKPTRFLPGTRLRFYRGR